MLATVVDSGITVVAGAPFGFTLVIERIGAPMDLTGKTVTGTIRRESAGNTVLNALLEDIAFASAAPLTGVVSADLTTVQSTALAPVVAHGFEGTDSYLIQLHVMPDEYFPQLIRFYARKKLD